MSTKDKVIEILEKEKGQFVSGESLANICGVSRNAIWKSVADLKKKGYKIQSVNNRGYMLEEASDIISSAGILLYLDEFLKKNPYQIHVFDELDSTNNEAKRSLFFKEANTSHGMVFVAKRQSAGRGHGESDFSSPEGGIYFSVILDPSKIKSKEPITALVKTSVADVLEKMFEVKLKRKKDSSLYLNEKKISGILTEGVSDLETGIYSNYIVGIGIRVEELQMSSDSPDKNRVIAEILNSLYESIK